METDLARTFTSAMVSAVLGALLSLPAVGAPVSIIDRNSADTLPETSPGAAMAQPPNPFDPASGAWSLGPRPGTQSVETATDEAPILPSGGGGLFHSREFELSIVDEKNNMSLDPDVCVYPDNYLRVLGGGRDNCAVIKPGGVESSVFTLAFLALSGWALLILAVTGLYHFYGSWRLRRWLRRSGIRTGGVSAVNPARLPQHRAPRSNSRTERRPRRYAG